MNTKMAIEFLEGVKLEPVATETAKGYLNSCIKLLQRGEKYRVMWEELEKHKCLLVDFDDEGYFKRNYFLSEIKQRYFPKEK